MPKGKKQELFSDSSEDEDMRDDFDGEEIAEDDGEDEEMHEDEELDSEGLAEDEDDEEVDTSDDEEEVDDDDEEGLTRIERQSLKLIKKKAKEAKLAQKELELNVKSNEIFELPSIEDVEKQLATMPSLEIIKERMFDVIQVLGDFNNRKQDGKTRKEYLDVLRKDLCAYYGYNEYLMAKFMELFPNFSEVCLKNL